MLINALSSANPSPTGAASVKGDTSPRDPAPQPHERNEDALREAITVANKTMRSLSNSLEFSLDPESRKMVVRVIDNETRQVIRQFPSEEMMSIARALDQMQGLLVNRNA